MLNDTSRSKAAPGSTVDLAQIYLGNCWQNPELQQQIEIARRSNACLEVELNLEDQRKSRIYARTISGEAIGIVKQRQEKLAEGDVFQTQQQRILVIHLQAQQVMMLSFTNEYTLHQPGDALKLIHLGHTLGNHHYPVLVAPDKIYVQLSGDPTRVESIIQSFAIPGLQITYETRSPDQLIEFTAHDSHSVHASHSHSH